MYRGKEDESSFYGMNNVYGKDDQLTKYIFPNLGILFFQGNIGSNKGVNSFLASAVDWPRVNRDGRKLATSNYFESIIKILDDFDNFPTSFHVWRKLLSTTITIAKFESSEAWNFAHKCCHALLDHHDMNENKMTGKLVDIAVEVANVTKDPLLATDIIRRVGVNRESDTTPSIPVSTYMQLITMCIENSNNESAENILDHCINSGAPINTMKELYCVVLNGYAHCGDLENAEKMISQMKELGLEQRYVNTFKT